MAVLGQARMPATTRFATFTHAVAFVLGFSAVFVALGAAVTAVGQLLYDLRSWLALLGGIVVVVFGLATAGVLNLPFLEYDTRYQGTSGRDLGYVSSFLMGVFFSAGWTPCVGPTLGAILTLGLNEQTVVMKVADTVRVRVQPGLRVDLVENRIFQPARAGYCV